MSCSHEHHDHGDGHDHHNHDHEVPLSSGPSDSLYGQIDLPNVVALNAQGGGDAGKNVIKTWEDKEDETRCCESDADDSLIIKIPFTASISLRSIAIKSGPSGKTPSAIHLFRDSPGMDFSDAESSTATQVFEAIETREGAEYQVKAAKFAGLTSLTIFFPSNNSDGEENTTRVYYVGLRGKYTALPNRPGVIIYESAARPTDHKVEGTSEGATYRPGY